MIWDKYKRLIEKYLTKKIPREQFIQEWHLQQMVDRQFSGR